MNIVVARRPTVSEIDALKAALKAANIPASVRIQKNIKRSYGSVSVIPGFQTRQANGLGFKCWTDEQTAQVLKIMRDLGFYVPAYKHEIYCYKQSICYIMHLTADAPVAPEPVKDAPTSIERVITAKMTAVNSPVTADLDEYGPICR